MTVAAMALYGVSLIVTFGVRVAVQLRRTGSTGVHGLDSEAGPLERFAGILFACSLLAAGSAPALALLDILEPIPSLDGSVGHAIGLILACGGIVLTFGAQLAMGDAWRIGVDSGERTELVTGGPFELVRNPIYSAMTPTVLGLVLMVPSVVAVVAFVALVIALELQVRTVEEPYLLRVHGADYANYAARVGRFVPRFGLLPGGIMFLAIAFTAVAGALAPSHAGAAGHGTIPAPGGFQLQGSNGFTVAVVARPPGWGFPSQVSLVASRKGAYAYYAAPGTVTRTSFAADFGALGRVSVTYRPTGGEEQLAPSCGSDAFFSSGVYEGTIEFHGEGGYTDISSSWARGHFDPPCGTRSESVGGRITGAQLSAHAFSFEAGNGLTFEAVKNRPTAPAMFEATLIEASSDIAIVRSVRARAPSSLFHFGASLRRAVVKPPAPFSGSASFRRDGRGQGHWEGGLKVGFPGKPGVGLTGRGFGVSLRHAEVKETRR
jgi:protein-S-isoprenylcysteine O-methyltransferase Ste14